MKRQTERRAADAAMHRREALAAMGFGALGLSLPSWREFSLARAAGTARTFFTPEERALITMMADMIIPRDDQSGNVSDSGSIDYMDFVMSEADERNQAAARAELRWYNDECTRRFGRIFVECSEKERAAILDDIAWPRRATPAMKPHAETFNRLRDLVASAFFSSRMGVEDLGYQGNVYNPGWSGAPPEALEGLGVSYDEWDKRYGGLQ